MPEVHQLTYTERLARLVFERLSEARHESFSDATLWLVESFNNSKGLRRPRSESDPVWENLVRTMEENGNEI